MDIYLSFSVNRVIITYMIKGLFYILGLFLGFFIFLNFISYKSIIFNSIEKFNNKAISKLNKAPKKNDKILKSLVKNTSTNSLNKPINDTSTDSINKPKIFERPDEIIKKSLDKRFITNKPTPKPQDIIPNKQKIRTEMFENVNLLTLDNKILENANLIILLSVYNNNMKDTAWNSELIKKDGTSLNFTYDNKIIYQTFPLNPYIKGVYINNVSLIGPTATLLTKNINKLIKNFTIMFMVKINDFKKKFNYLLEIKCKPSYEYNHKTDEKKYIENIIYISIKDNSIKETNINKCGDDDNCKKIQKKLKESINIHNSHYFYNKDKMNEDNDGIQKCLADESCSKKINFLGEEIDFFNQLRDNKYYNIEITIGTEIFHIYNINSDIFKDDNTFIGIILNGSELSFYINNNIHKFKLIRKSDIIADSFPITINDNGNIDMVLYSFSYFDEALNDIDINIFKMYNNYYLFGGNQINQEREKYITYNKELKAKMST